jgi:hypothetical protein
MKNILISLMAAAVLVFSTGCGGNTCDDLEDANNSVNDKLEDCSDGANDGDTGADAEQCREALLDCTDADQEKLSDYASCRQDLPDCKEGELDAWLDEALKCSDKLEGLSPSCAAVFVDLE